LESGFPGKREEPIRAGITAIVFIVGYSYLALIMAVRSIQLMAIVKPHVGGNGVLFALNAILPLGGVLRENLKQVSILRNPWDQFSMER
jgi:hypothetical protein